MAMLRGFEIPAQVAGVKQVRHDQETSIGTLFAFLIVCAGVRVTRVKNPDEPRPFRTRSAHRGCR
jgi:hypothetical protein